MATMFKLTREQLLSDKQKVRSRVSKSDFLLIKENSYLNVFLEFAQLIALIFTATYSPYEIAVWLWQRGSNSRGSSSASNGLAAHSNPAL